jgi:hypothetical protein
MWSLTGALWIRCLLQAGLVRKGERRKSAPSGPATKRDSLNPVPGGFLSGLPAQPVIGGASVPPLFYAASRPLREPSAVMHTVHHCPGGNGAVRPPLQYR